jgi:hypothetical protein
VAEPEPEPRIHYPIPAPEVLEEAGEPPASPPATAVTAPVAQEGAAPLPPLGDSDEEISAALQTLLEGPQAANWLRPGNLVRHIVVTVDNLAREKLPEKLRPVQPVEGRFLVEGDPDQPLLSAENYRRYAPYVALAESLDVDRLTALYIHYYPLFQEAYLDLGYPTGYFNDRLVEVIDRLLETPEIEGAIRLARPHVLYRYADPELEALTAGQKLLLRMGPAHARRIKILLHDIRQRVTRFAPTEGYG